MIASYPLHKASLSFPRRGEKAQSVSEKIPHWPSPLLLLTGPTPPPPSSVKVSSPPLRSLGFFPLSLALTSPSGCDLCSLSHLPLFFPLSPPPLSLSAPPPPLPFFLPCCQELFNMESYMCFSPFAYPTRSQTQLPNGDQPLAFLRNLTHTEFVG